MKNLPAMKTKGCWYASRWHYFPEAGVWGINFTHDGHTRYWGISHQKRSWFNDYAPTGYYLYEVINGGGKRVPCIGGAVFKTLREAQENSYAMFHTLYDVEFIGGDQHGFMPGEEIKPWYGKR